MAAALGRSVVLAAVRHEAEQLRAESALVRRRLEALAAVERALVAISADADLTIFETWMESAAAGAGRPASSGSAGQAPIERILPPEHVALTEESLVGLVARMFARYAEAADVDLGIVDLAEASPRLSPAEVARLHTAPALALVPGPEEGAEVPDPPPGRRRTRRGILSATVYGFLATLPYALRASEIARRLNLKLENVCAALMVLEHRGLIRTNHDGKFYALAPAAPPVPRTPPPARPAPTTPPTSPRIVRDGDREFEVVNPPRPSAYLGSSIGSEFTGE